MASGALANGQTDGWTDSKNSVKSSSPLCHSPLHHLQMRGRNGGHHLPALASKFLIVGWPSLYSVILPLAHVHSVALPFCLSPQRTGTTHKPTTAFLQPTTSLSLSLWGTQALPLFVRTISLNAATSRRRRSGVAFRLGQISRQNGTLPIADEHPFAKRLSQREDGICMCTFLCPARIQCRTPSRACPVPAGLTPYPNRCVQRALNNTLCSDVHARFCASALCGMSSVCCAASTRLPCLFCACCVFWSHGRFPTGHRSCET